jgi:hypothetical protein
MTTFKLRNLSLLRPLSFTTLLLLAACNTPPRRDVYEVVPPPPPAPMPVEVAPPPRPVLAAQDEEKLHELVLAMKDLLNLAPDLARARWARKQAAEDKEQDRRWLAIAAQLAKAQSLPVERVEAFVQAQIDAANFARRGMFAQWQTTPSTLPLKVGADGAAEAAIAVLVKRYGVALSVLRRPGSRATLEALALAELPNRTALSEPTRKLAMAPLLDMAR